MKIALPLVEAEAIAGKLLRSLRATGAISRGIVVGSIRRRKAAVGDIELLLEPASGFGHELGLAGVLNDIGLRRAPPQGGRRRPWATKYYCATWPLDHPEGQRPEGAVDFSVQVDIFVRTYPADWGPLEVIRTGDAHFSQAVVTRLHRWGMRTEDGRVLKTVRQDRITSGDGLGATTHIPCPDEASFFRIVRLDYIEPELRSWDNGATRAKVLAEGPP